MGFDDLVFGFYPIPVLCFFCGTLKYSVAGLDMKS